MMEDPRVEFYKKSLGGQRGGGSYPVFEGTSRYQYGAGFGDVLRGIWRVFFPTVVKGAASFLNAGSKALDKNQSVGEVLRAGIKPAIGSMFKVAGREVARTNFGPEAAPPPGPIPRHPDGTDAGTIAPTSAPPAATGTQAGSGKRRKRTATRHKRTGGRKLPSLIGYNF